MHCVLGVVTVFFLEFGAVNILLPLLPEQSFHLVVCESEKRLYMSLREENLGSGGKVIPCAGCELERREEEMQRGRVDSGGKSGGRETF